MSPGDDATAPDRRPAARDGATAAQDAAGAGEAPVTAGKAPVTAGKAPVTAGKAPVTAGEAPATDAAATSAGDGPPRAGEGAAGAGLLRGLSRSRKIIIAAGTCCLAAVALIFSIGPGGSSSRAESAQPPAKPFTLRALGHAGRVSLSQYAGRPVVVNFFASWCGPCQKETPLLARFYRADHRKVAIIGIDVNDSTANAVRFVRRADASYPIGADPTTAIAARYGVVAIPQTFFLNADHHIVKRVFGAVTLPGLKAGLARMR